MNNKKCCECEYAKTVTMPHSEASYYHGYTEYVFGELGTGFFLTKEAAEQAVKERESIGL